MIHSSTKELSAAAETTVTAITPIRPGADLGLLRIALTTAATSLGATFQWRYACGPAEAEAIQALAGELGIADAYGIVTSSANVAATRNLLTAMGDGDYLLVIDADDAYAPGGLAQMKWVLDTKPQVVAAHGRTLDTDVSGTTVIFDPPAWWNTFPGDIAAPGALAVRRQEMAKAQRAWFNTPTVISGYPVCQCAGLYRRPAVLAVGGWDEELGNFGEDTAMTAKLAHRYPWFLTHGTVVSLYRKGTGTLSGRYGALTAADIATVNAITDAHEEGRSMDAPAPPWLTPPVDRAPRPVLISDDELRLTLPEGADGRPAMSLVDQFVAPLHEVDPAAKHVPGVDTEDPDDQAPDLDEHPANFESLLEDLRTPQKKGKDHQ